MDRMGRCIWTVLMNWERNNLDYDNLTIDGDHDVSEVVFVIITIDIIGNQRWRFQDAFTRWSADSDAIPGRYYLFWPDLLQICKSQNHFA